MKEIKKNKKLLLLCQFKPVELAEFLGDNICVLTNYEHFSEYVNRKSDFIQFFLLL